MRSGGERGWEGKGKERDGRGDGKLMEGTYVRPRIYLELTRLIHCREVLGFGILIGRAP